MRLVAIVFSGAPIIVCRKHIHGALRFFPFWKPFALGVVLDNVGQFQEEEAGDCGPALQSQAPVVELRVHFAGQLAGAAKPWDLTLVRSLECEAACVVVVIGVIVVIAFVGVSTIIIVVVVVIVSGTALIFGVA